MFCTLVVSKPNLEARVTRHLERQGFRHYRPMAELVDRRGHVVVQSLFPRYVFVWVADAWRALLNTFGVCAVVRGHEGGPARVPEAVVAAIKQREDNRGLVVLRPAGFAVNQMVRIRAGPMEGTAALFQSMRGRDRAEVLVSMFGGGQVMVVVREADLTAD